MASRELQLISRIVTSGNISKVMEWGITTEDFHSRECRAMFEHLFGYYYMQGTQGSVIGPQLMSVAYPGLMLCDDPGMTTEALCLEVRKEHITRIGVESASTLARMFEINPVKALNMAQEMNSRLQNIGLGNTSDLSIGAAFDREISRYKLLASGFDPSVGTWPWYSMQVATGGFQPDDYVVLYGRPKSFKSWILSYIITHTIDQGKSSIIYTKEMTPENIFRRIIACMANVNYRGLRTGRLPVAEVNRLETARCFINALRAREKIHCLSGKDAPDGGDTVPWIRAKAEKFKPDFIFIDGMYLMSDVRHSRRESERVKSISRDLSELRLNLNIPVIVTIQANREAAKNQEANLDEVAFSDALSQDATCVIRVINETKTPTCMLILGGAREFTLEGFRINAIPAYDFSYNSELRRKEIKKALEEDTSGSAWAPPVTPKEQQAMQSIRDEIGNQLYQ